MTGNVTFRIDRSKVVAFNRASRFTETREIDLLAAHLKHLTDSLGMIAIIIDNEYVLAHADSLICSNGSRSWVNVPFPTSLDISILPPWASTIFLTMGSPSPLP